MVTRVIEVLAFWCCTVGWDWAFLRLQGWVWARADKHSGELLTFGDEGR